MAGDSVMCLYDVICLRSSLDFAIMIIVDVLKAFGINAVRNILLYICISLVSSVCVCVAHL